MTDNPTGPELLQSSIALAREMSEPRTDSEYLNMAAITGLHALTAAVVMAVDAHTGGRFYELDAWREVIPVPPLKECKSKEARRPECAERHTEDCDYADPIPEPPHELLPIGTRVLISPRATKYDDGRVVYDKQPKVAKVVGYDAFNSKYQLNDERPGGGYYDFVTWAFADNRVQPHPEQDSAIAEPTGPRVYVEDRRGKQGYIIEVKHIEKDDSLWYTVQYFAPGAEPVDKRADSFIVIAESQVQRCPNGQTFDECGSGENQCERCLAAEDAEAKLIEDSMDV